MEKILDKIKNYPYQRRHTYKHSLAVVEGVSYNVIAVTPIGDIGDTIKKAADMIGYLVNGK